MLTMAAVAYHESGHAVIARRHGLRVDSVEIWPDGVDRGFCAHSSPEILTTGFLLVLLAGQAAAHRHTGRPLIECGGEHDEERARHWVARKLCRNRDDPAVDRQLNTLRTLAFGEVVLAWRAIDALACELLRRRRLERDAIRAIIARVSI
jgi:hypothetical protein